MGEAKKLRGLHEVIAEIVRWLRKAKGLSHEALAEHRVPPDLRRQDEAEEAQPQDR